MLIDKAISLSQLPVPGVLFSRSGPLKNKELLDVMRVSGYNKW